MDTPSLARGIYKQIVSPFGSILELFRGYEQDSCVPDCLFLFREMLPTRVKHHLTRFPMYDRFVFFS